MQMTLIRLALFRPHLLDSFNQPGVDRTSKTPNEKNPTFRDSGDALVCARPQKYLFKTPYMKSILFSGTLVAKHFKNPTYEVGLIFRDSGSGGKTH